ncbi:unnamed protein product [Closterium sp. NIES-53]
MASLRILTFDHEGRPIQFDTWLDDLQLYLLRDSWDSVSLFDLASGTAPAPPATADSATRSQTTEALYDAVVARYSSPATAALGLLLLPYLFPELSAFATVEDLVSHLRASDTRYCAALSAEFLDRNPPPMYITLYFIVTHLTDSLRSVKDHFLSLDPSSLTVDLLEQHLLAARTSAVACKAPQQQGQGVVEGAAGVVVGAAVEAVKAVEVVAAVEVVEGVGALVAAVEAAVGVAVVAAVAVVAVGLELSVEVLEEASGSGSSVGARPLCLSSFVTVLFGDDFEHHHWAELLRSGVAIFDLDYDAILFAMYAMSVSAEGDSYQCVPPDPSIDAASLGACEPVLPGTTPAEALHTFTMDSRASRCFFRDSATLTPLPAPVPVRVADPSGPRLLPVPPLSSRVWRFYPARCQVFTSPRSLRTWVESVHTGYRASSSSCVCSGVCIRSGSTPLLMSPPVAPDSSVAPPPGSPLPATPSWHALPSPCLWSSQVSPSPPALACPALPSLRQGAAARHSSILLVSPDDCSPADSPHGRRHIGLVMEVARTSMIHAVAPHFLWSFAVRYAVHQLNLWPRVSLPETSPTLRWTGEVGDASVFRVWGSRGFVRDTSLDKLSARAIPYLFLGLIPDAHGWQFYHPTLRRVFPSQDITFDESVPFYRVSQVDPLPGTALVEVVVGSGAARGAASGGAASGGAEPRFAESEGAGSGGAEPGGEEPGGDETAGVEPRDAEPEGVEPGGAESEGVESRGAEPHGAASSRGLAGASPRLSPQQVREWLVCRACLQSGATRAEGVGAGGAEVTAGAGGTGGTAATSPGGGRTRGTGAAGTGGVGGTGAGDPTEPRAARARGSGAGGVGVGGARAGGSGSGGAGARGAGVGGTGAGGVGADGTNVGGTGVGGTGAGGIGAGGAGAVDPGGTVRPRPYFVPLLQQILGVPSSTCLTPPILFGSLTERHEPASRPISPVCTARRVPRLRPPLVPGTHAMALRPSSVPLRVPLPAPPESSLPEVPDPKSDRACAATATVSRLLATAVDGPSFESAAASALVAELLDFAAACRLDYATALVAKCALCTNFLEDRQEDFECLAPAVPRFASMLLAPEGDPDAPDIPTPRSYAEAITGPYSSHWQAAMDVEMASWKSTGTYINEVPPLGANIVNGMWIFRVKRPPGSPPAFKASYVARRFSQRQGVHYFQTFSPTLKMTNLRVLLHVAAQRDYELHSLDFSTAFLQGSQYEEIWLRRPPGFTGSFLAGTQRSLCWPVYGLLQAPREWHDTLRTTLAALGFAPSTANPSLFLRTHTSLPPFYVLVYVEDLVFANAHTKALTLVLQRFVFQFSSPQPTPLSTGHSLSAPPSNESVEPSGRYPERVGCLMYLMTCTRPDLAYPLSLLACYVAPGRHRKVHWDVVKRVMRYLCSTSCIGLVLGGRGPVVLTGHADASWVDELATQW